MIPQQINLNSPASPPLGRIELMIPDEISNVPKRGEKIEALIAQYDWVDKNLLKQDLLNIAGYCDFLDFLYDSKIFYSIRAYETSLKDSNSELKEGIKIINGQPHLLKEGQWTSWDLILSDIQYDPTQQKFLLKNAQGEWKECNYLYPNGLISQTRYNWIEHVHQLNPNEMGRLYEHGLKFFKQGKKAPLRENCGFIQVFTGGKNRLDQIGHVGLRMIDKEGKVYSFGFETPNNEAEPTLKKLFRILATYNVAIASRDFKEFSKFDIRRTTTIPVTEEKFHNALEKVKNYAKTPLRFNFLHQNCMTFALDILKTAGIQANIKTSSVSKALYDLVRPSIKNTPYIGPLFQTITDRTKPILTAIRKGTPAPICFMVKAITFIPGLTLTMIKNSTFLIFGAGKEGSPPQLNEENETNNSKRLRSFHRVFNHWTDFFKNNALNMSIPYKFADWQMEQESTEIYSFNGPQFYIVPPEKKQEA